MMFDPEFPNKLVSDHFRYELEVALKQAYDDGYANAIAYGDPSKPRRPSIWNNSATKRRIPAIFKKLKAVING